MILDEGLQGSWIFPQTGGGIGGDLGIFDGTLCDQAAQGVSLPERSGR